MVPVSPTPPARPIPERGSTRTSPTAGVAIVSYVRGLATRLAFWGSAGALVWTHAGYPLLTGLLARRRPRPVASSPTFRPAVTIVVAAHDEEDGIARRLENLAGQTYPPELVDVIVASDGSTDATDDIVRAAAARDGRVSLLSLPPRGKVAAQHDAVRVATGEVVAFTDANTTWAPDALERLVAPLADPEVGYVCGRLELERSGGGNKEGLYWRYELWLRTQESAAGSITGGNGAIYAVRRAEYEEDDPRFGHDLGMPYRAVQRGRRAVYEPAALASEPEALESHDEYGRKVRMFAQSWGHILSGRILGGGVGPLYTTAIVSHRLLRYSIGLLHAAAFASNVLLVRRGRIYRLALASQLTLLALAAAGRRRLRVPGAGVAYYYVSLAAATVDGLYRYLRHGTPLRWDKARGTRGGDA
jgi:cellulose synthase/poly-beta-1,6-N-acetylglucosamine synthase-like glycosyltransferase